MSCHQHYRRSTWVRTAVTAVMGGLALALFLADVAVGTSDLSIFQALVALFAPETDPTAFIVREIRLPSALTAVTVGAALSLAGLLIQTITALAITSGFSIAGELWLGTVSAAFAAALLISGAILKIGHRNGMSPAALILAGIVMNFFFMSLQELLLYLASPETAQLINGWTFGNLERAGKLAAATPAVALAAALVVTVPAVWQLTTLSIGEERAKSLGVPVEKLRLTAFASAALLVAAAVSFIGTIGFLGLVAPHIARLLLGDDQRFLIPGTAFTGAALLSGASLAAKMLSVGSLIPVGIVTSLVGVPFLFFLLIRSRRML